MKTHNNTSSNISFQQLYIRNRHSWDPNNLKNFRENKKIQTFANELDKKGVDLIAKPYNYIDSGNKPENFGVHLYLKLKNNAESKSGFNEILTKSYHCTVSEVLSGFKVKKALKMANKDIEYLKGISQ